MLWWIGAALAAGGTLEERLQCASDDTLSYALYRPAGFDPAREWPVLLVLDPRGNALVAAERFYDAADAYGFVVASSYDTRSDVLSGPDPNVPAINCVLGDLDERVPVDPDALVLAGFSGTARVAWEVGRALPDLVYAILSVGAGVNGDDPVAPAPFAVFLAAGTRDFNYQEARATDAALAGLGASHRVELFEGRHEWPPADVSARMLAWAAVEGQRRGRLPADDAAIDRALEADRAWLATADPWAARSGADAVARTYDGLRDVSAERATAERLASDPDVVARDKVERKLVRTEERYRARLQSLVQWLDDRGRTPPTPTEGLFALGTSQLQKKALEDSPAGDSAARMLALTRGSLSYYVPGYARAAGNYGDGAPSLAIAAAIWPDDAAIRYDLACAWALAGRPDAALHELEQAVALGFDDGAWLASDPDLQSLHGDPHFEAIVERLR